MQYQITNKLADNLNIELDHYMNCRLGDSCKRCKQLIKEMGAIKV